MYEKVPRQERGSGKVLKALLPTKGKAGLVHRTIEMEPAEGIAETFRFGSAVNKIIRTVYELKKDGGCRQKGTRLKNYPL